MGDGERAHIDRAPGRQVRAHDRLYILSAPLSDLRGGQARVLVGTDPHQEGMSLNE